MKIHTMLPGLEDAGAQARRLEALGVDGLFTFEGPRDIFTPLVLAAANTATVGLMTNVAIAFPRNPIQLAQQANDLQTLSRGRFTLGLGSQVRAQIEKRYGVAFDHPIARMRELIGALRAVFTSWEGGGPLRFEGDFYRHSLMTPMFNPGPNPYGPPPIFLGALGPQMTRLAAESADGLLVMPFNSRRHFQERTLPMVDQGLARAGRSAADLDLVGEVIVCCGRTEEELTVADQGTRRLLSFYGSTPSYRPVLDVEGWGELQRELNTLSKEGRWDEMAGRIEPAMLCALAARGTPRDVAADIKGRFGHRVQQICIYTPYAISAECFADLVGALGSGSRVES
jgi:probable F420-dependent oxidoreductase